MIPEDLIKKAREAQKRAKAMYSDYAVGAALLTTDNQVILGCNIESKAYPTTICAERVAIFSAISQGYTKFKAIAVVTKDGGMPCGSCRQIIHEYSNGIPIYVSDQNENFKTFNISSLLPHPFG